MASDRLSCVIQIYARQSPSNSDADFSDSTRQDKVAWIILLGTISIKSKIYFGFSYLLLLKANLLPIYYVYIYI